MLWHDLYHSSHDRMTSYVPFTDNGLLTEFTLLVPEKISDEEPGICPELAAQIVSEDTRPFGNSRQGSRLRFGIARQHC